MKKSIVAFSAAALLSGLFVSSASASTYTVKKGDTLTKVAKKYNLTVNKLKELNNLKSNTIYTNQKLVTSTSKTTAETTAAKATISIKSEKTTTYKVIAGDTLTKIAQKYGLTVNKLKELNNLTSDTIYVNQKLVISASKANTAATAAKATVSIKNEKTTTYKVVAGDTLTKIAQKHGLTVNKLKELNNLTSDTIYVNQKLVISASKANTAAKATVSIKNEKTTTYKVVAGDTLIKIANKYNLTLAELKHLNKLSSNVIKVGDTLIVSSSSTETIIDLPEETKSSANTYKKENGPSIEKAIEEAKKVIGTPYSWAGSTPAGFDCSGFVYYAFKKAGYSISRHSSSTYYALGKKVSSPQRGDLVFFATGSNRSVVSHLGIYLGDNQFIHASSSKGITISSVNNSYFKSRLIGYKRLNF